MDSTIKNRIISTLAHSVIAMDAVVGWTGHAITNVKLCGYLLYVCALHRLYLRTITLTYRYVCTYICTIILLFTFPVYARWSDPDYERAVAYIQVSEQGIVLVSDKGRVSDLLMTFLFFILIIIIINAASVLVTKNNIYSREREGYIHHALYCIIIINRNNKLFLLSTIIFLRFN